MKKIPMLFLVPAMTLAFAASAAEPASSKAKVDKAEPVGVKSKLKTVEPCCAITSINMTTGVVTMKDLKTGQMSNVTVQNKAKLDALRVGQKVSKNL